MLDGNSRSRKRPAKDYLATFAIAAAGVLLAYMTRDQRGQVSLILGCLSILAATGWWHWHGRNSQAFALLVGVVPVAVILGMALAFTAATRAPAANVTKTAGTGTETVTAGIVGLFHGDGK